MRGGWRECPWPAFVAGFARARDVAFQRQGCTTASQARAPLVAVAGSSVVTALSATARVTTPPGAAFTCSCCSGLCPRHGKLGKCVSSYLPWVRQRPLAPQPQRGAPPQRGWRLPRALPLPAATWAGRGSTKLHGWGKLERGDWAAAAATAAHTHAGLLAEGREMRPSPAQASPIAPSTAG